VERPFVETLILPTTWRELGIGLTGDLGRGFRYRAYMLSALNARFFDAGFGIAEGRTRGFDASLRNPAQAARLEYAGIRRMTLGASIYTGLAGFDTPGINPRVTIGEFDGRYSYRRFDLRGLFAKTWISRAGELNAAGQRQTGVNPNIARQLLGYYVEPGVHVFPRRLRSDFIVFGRYEKYDTQYKMPAGYLPLPQFQRSSWVTGVTFKPNPDVADDRAGHFAVAEVGVVPAPAGHAHVQVPGVGAKRGWQHHDGLLVEPLDVEAAPGGLLMLWEVFGHWSCLSVATGGVSRMSWRCGARTRRGVPGHVLPIG
jgi:hypothetical protein